MEQGLNSQTSTIYERVIQFYYTPHYSGNIQKDKESFFDYCRKKYPEHFTPNVLNKIESAIDFMYKYFKDDRRGDGTMFYTHFFETAHILLSKFKITDLDTIISAFLHDLVEDKPEVNIKTIKNMFGPNVAGIVDGVTKITNSSELEKEFQVEVNRELSYEDQELATIQKIFKYGIKYPQIFLVKFADRYHNVQTLYGIKKSARRREIANQTINIYVPLIKMLGYEEVSKELRDMCLFHIIAENPKEAEQMYQKLKEIHKEEFYKFIKTAQENNLEETLNSIVTSKSDQIHLVVAHKTLFDLHEALVSNSWQVPMTYQHFYWVVNIPAEVYDNNLIRSIDSKLRDEFRFISMETLTFLDENLLSGVILYLPVSKYNYVLPNGDGFEIVFNIVSSEKKSIDIEKTFLNKSAYKSYDEREYNAFLELIEYLYSQEIKDKMQLLLEFAKRMFPTEFVSIKNNVQETFYVVPNGFTVLDAAFKLMPDEAFKVISAKVYKPNHGWLSKSLNYVFENNDVFEFIKASNPIYELDDLKPFSLVAINEIRKIKQKIERKEIKTQQKFVKTISLKGIDKLGLTSLISNVAVALNVSFTKVYLNVDRVNPQQFNGSIAGKFSTVENLNFFVLGLGKIKDIKEISVV